MLVAVLVAIGCGGGKPQDASATTDHGTQPEAPIQLAEAPAGAAPAAAVGSAGVTGSVRFEGTAPAPEKVKMVADPVCAQQHAEAVYTEEVVINANGTLKNAVVFVKEGLSGFFPAPATPVVLDQHGCWYVPHVFAIQVGQSLEITNSDATLHNVNAKPAANTPFNLAQPRQGDKSTKRFAKAEVGVSFKCNVHPWMHAFAVVTEHPFFGVSGSDGSFAISGLPAGTYVLEAWHEKYGAQTQTVTVANGETKSVEFVFKSQ
jgi:plastocyanin